MITEKTVTQNPVWGLSLLCRQIECGCPEWSFNAIFAVSTVVNSDPKILRTRFNLGEDSINSGKSLLIGIRFGCIQWLVCVTIFGSWMV